MLTAEERQLDSGLSPKVTKRYSKVKRMNTLYSIVIDQMESQIKCHLEY